MNKIFELITEMRHKLEACRYDGKNDTQVMDAIQLLNYIDYLLLNQSKEHQSENGKLPISDIINRLQSMRPKVKFVEFDETRKNDYLYCVEWGIMKGQYIEQGVYDRYIAELNSLKS